MKIERRIRKIKPMIEEVCNEYTIPPPVKVVRMPNYFGRPERNFCKIEPISGTNYILKIREKMYSTSQELIQRTEQQIMESIKQEIQIVFGGTNNGYI